MWSAVLALIGIAVIVLGAVRIVIGRVFPKATAASIVVAANGAGGLFFKLLIVSVAATLLYGMWAGPGKGQVPGESSPLYTNGEQRFPASVRITVKRGDIDPWIPKEDVAYGFCFFRLANIARVDGLWYAVNGISRSRLKATSRGGPFTIRVNTHDRTILDMDGAEQSMFMFLMSMNDEINRACP